ncbi:MAG: hypothetical protein AAB758_03080 [Patescibacteria group bacterium]
MQHVPGYFADSAREIAECFSEVLIQRKSWVEVPYEVRAEMETFFTEGEEAIERFGESGVHYDTYDLVMRVLRSASYREGLFIPKGMTLRGWAEQEFRSLAKRFRTAMSGQVGSVVEESELFRLGEFFEGLAEESDRECYECFCSVEPYYHVSVAPAETLQ